MRLVLKRIAFRKTYTIGKLYVDGVYFCDTLEDPVREGEKIYGRTAIPAGKYDVLITMSPRFRKMLPLLLNVPGFEGVRIHSGNKADDTEGCILVGINDKPGWVSQSRATMTRLMTKLESADSPITLEVV